MTTSNATHAKPRRTRRPLAFKQGDIERALRAAERIGQWRVEIEKDGVVIRLTPVADEPPAGASDTPFARGLSIVP
jgi:hypothetical protein